MHLRPNLPLPDAAWLPGCLCLEAQMRMEKMLLHQLSCNQEELESQKRIDVYNHSANKGFMLLEGKKLSRKKRENEYLNTSHKLQFSNRLLSFGVFQFDILDFEKNHKFNPFLLR